MKVKRIPIVAAILVSLAMSSLCKRKRCCHRLTV